MVGLGSSDRGGGGVGVGVAINDRFRANRMKPQVRLKPMPNLPSINSNQKRNPIITDLNKRITDLKMEGGPQQTKVQLTDLQQRLQPPGGTQAQIRRDSNSTVSSYYGSMRSADMSRKSSLASQVQIIKILLKIINFEFPKSH